MATERTVTGELEQGAEAKEKMRLASAHESPNQVIATGITKLRGNVL